MPIRPLETIDYKIKYTGKTIAFTPKQLTDFLFILEVHTAFNATTEKLAQTIEIALKDIVQNVTVKARAYRGIHEGNGYEAITPRNYLTKEVIEVKVNNSEHVFLLGNFGALEEAPYFIINKLKEQYGKRPTETRPLRGKKKRSIYLDSATIDSVRAQFRRC